MNPKIIILFFACAIGLFSCNQEHPMNCFEPIHSEPEQLVFGHFFGMCGGETCVETFLLTSDQIFEDPADQYSGKFQQFPNPDNLTLLDQSSFETAQHLLDAFPGGLLLEENQVFGCPDCADQGGLRIVLQDGENLRQWTFDYSYEGVPDYLQPYLDEVKASIESLQE